MKTTLRPVPAALALLLIGANTAAQTTDPDTKATTLAPVRVTGKYEREDLAVRAPGHKAASGARLGILGTTSIMKAPVHVNAYTRELAEDWSALTLQDVLENDSAIVFNTNKNHLLQNFNLRGLDMSAMDIATNGLYGIAPANSVPIEMFERIEVLRGPNVLLSGMPPSSSVAGTVNMVTKRALAQPIADLTLTYGSRSYFQTHADVGQRFGDGKRLGLRFNGVYGDGEMGAKGEDQRRSVGALALDYMGERGRASLDIYSSVNKIDGGSPGMFNFLGSRGVIGLGRLLAPPEGDTNMFRGTHGKYTNSGLLARAEFDFSPSLQGYFAVGGSNSEGEGLLFGTRAVVTGADGSARGAIYNVHTESQRRTAEAGVIGSFSTGSVQHRLQLSANVLTIKEGTANTPCNYCYDTNIYNPVAPTFPAAPVWAGFTDKSDFRSLAVADVMSLAGDKLLLTLGGRHQTVKLPLEGYRESRFSPMVAAVVRPWGEGVSLFGNYTEGLEPGEVVGVGYANEGESLPPTRTRQVELGVKLQAGAMTHTFSAYLIRRPSYIVDSADYLVDGGEQRLQGVEWSMYGLLAPGLSVLGGITHITSEQRDAGSDTHGTPDLRVRVGLDWQTPLAGLKVGGRVIHTGKQWLDSGNLIRLPAWDRVDLNASYDMKVGSLPVRWNASVENLADRRYWIGTFSDGFAMPGAPRSFKVSATVSF